MSMFVPHRRVQVETGEFTFTKQSHKAECDINNILSQYKRTGMITHISARQAQYIDLPDASDLQEAFAVAEEANAAFMSLPAKVRDLFDHDPVKFLQALNDPSRADELRELGILREKTPADVALENTPAA